MFSGGGRERTWEVRTKSPEQTMHLGQICGQWLTQGTVIALMGDLGTGKTVFAKGVAKGVGVADEREVTSPSFVLVNEYQGRFPVYHVDLYRLHQARELEDLGWEELISTPGVTMIEWAEKALKFLPLERMEVYFQWVSAVERKLIFIGKGHEAQGLVQTLVENWTKEE